MLFLQKKGCGCPVLTLEPPSTATQRCTPGRRTDQTKAETRTDGNETLDYNRDKAGGARHKVTALPVIFVSTLFEIDDN